LAAIEAGLLWSAVHSLPTMMMPSPKRISECPRFPSASVITMTVSNPNAASSHFKAAFGSR
jgi:hypothetical protein